MGVDIMSINNPTIPGLIRPVVPTSVPFVYRDGLTMLQLIECIKHNMDTLQEYVNGVMDNVNKALEDQTTQNRDTLDKAQQAAQDAADAIQQAQDALRQYQQIVANVNTALNTANMAIDRLEALGVTDSETATELKNTIQQTATDLTALTERVTTAENNITELQNKDAEIENNLTNTTSQTQTNKTDIANINANLNALHANSTGDATTLYNTIQNSSHILVVNQPFMSRGSNIIVTFGDSYANAANARSWAYMIAQKLGWTLHNYAIAGAGYIAPNTTYMSEFLTARADTTYNHNDVSLVVIGGSRNSNDQYSGNLKKAARELFQAVSAEYPNARIIAIPLLWDKTPESGYWRYNAASIAEAAILAGIESIPWAWTWNLGREDAFDGENIHPNEVGTNVIVNYIMRYMLGTYNGRHEVFVWRPTKNPAEFVLTVDASAGTITYGLAVASNVTPANYTNVSGLPMWAWNASDSTNQGHAWVAAITNGAGHTTLFHIDTNGHFGWQGFTTEPTATPNGLAGTQFTRAW